MNDETRSQLVDLLQLHFRSLVEAHLERIEGCAEDDEKGCARVAVGLVIDYSGKSPACSINISYASRTKDGTTFKCDDPQQLKLLKAQ
jgi:ATP-dependent helicase YprA (DUF1998 family)